MSLGDVEDGFNREQVRQQQEAWAVADLEDLLMCAQVQLALGMVHQHQSRGERGRRTPAPMMPTRSFWTGMTAKTIV